MKRKVTSFLFLVVLTYSAGLAQNKPDNSKIDMMLIRGDFRKAIDTCNLILLADSLNSEVYYKLGLAYQNLLLDDKSFECYNMAATISPENNNYNFTVAKNLFNRGKMNQAKQLLMSLCSADTMNWPYSFYLTNIYMQEGRYDESIKIYNRFYREDSANYVFNDKIGFAYLRKGDSEKAIDFFNRSLALNTKNINAIKNVAYLYAVTYRIDTAIQLLTRGIETDPADMDLYARRAALNYSINYNKRALNDYLKILSSGDSSFIYLKRAGIGYTNNFQPKEAMVYLLKAHQKDTSDLEVLSFLARNYKGLNDLKKSAECYRRIIAFLKEGVYQSGLNYILLAEVLKSDNQYVEAINAYLKSQEYRADISLFINIANLYDEKLRNTPKAIFYYELFLEKLKTAKTSFSSAYIKTIKDRVAFLKKPGNSPQK